MVALKPGTVRRLRQIKQSPFVWEGARCGVAINPRRLVSNVVPIIPSPLQQDVEYIIWADATNGVVRSVFLVEPNGGMEVFVRSLLQAIEYPQGNLPPLRPQRVILNDRQTQFYLRGILQTLEISVEYAETLPLVEEIINSLREQNPHIAPPLPPALAPTLYLKILRLWEERPWHYLYDHQVLEVQLDRWDVSSFYVTFMGKLGLEIGLIFYHSLDNLKQFRLNSMGEDMAHAFMQQDCIFMIFNRDEEIEPDMKQFMHSLGWTLTNYYPHFGVLHPLEGEREFLYEEEVLAITATIDVLIQFFRQHKKQFRHDQFPPLTATYTPSSVPDPTPITIRTLVEEAAEIMSFVPTEVDETSLIAEDIIPHGSLLRLTFFDGETLELMRAIAPHKVVKNIQLRGKSHPTLLVQNTKPEINSLISTLEGQNNLQGVGFITLEFNGDVGLWVTGNGNIYRLEAFTEEWQAHPVFKRWKQECQANNCCIVLLAMGLKGKAKGNPRPSHILGYYEVDCISSSDLTVQIGRKGGKRLS